MEKIGTLEIYIDGSSCNPGPSGWAAVCNINGKKKASRGNTTHATNNQAELYAAIQAINATRRPSKIILFTDSRYLITCYAHGEKWLSQEGRKNGDLWLQFIKAVKNGKHEVSFVKVAGHAGIEMNELADKLAKEECVKARHKLIGEY